MKPWMVVCSLLGLGFGMRACIIERHEATCAAHHSVLVMRGNFDVICVDIGAVYPKPKAKP